VDAVEEFGDLDDPNAFRDYLGLRYLLDLRRH
jgi:hypothetical protein